MSLIGLTYGAQPVLPADTTPPSMAYLTPGHQVLAANSLDQPVLGATSSPSGFPFAGSQNHRPSTPGPCPGPNSIGPHRAAVAPTATTPPSMAHLPLGLPVSADPGIQVLAADSIDQPVWPATSAPSGFPFAGSQSYGPSPSGPCPWPNTIGPHRAVVASTTTTPPPMAHLPSHRDVPVGLPEAPDPNQFVPVGLPVSPDTGIQVLAAVSIDQPVWPATSVTPDPNQLVPVDLRNVKSRRTNRFFLFLKIKHSTEFVQNSNQQ